MSRPYSPVDFLGLHESGATNGQIRVAEHGVIPINLHVFSPMMESQDHLLYVLLCTETISIKAFTPR